MKRYLVFASFDYQGGGMNDLSDHTDDLLEAMKLAMSTKPRHQPVLGRMLDDVICSSVFDTEKMKEIMCVNHTNKRFLILDRNIDETTMMLFRVGYRNDYAEDQPLKRKVAA